MAKKLFVTGTGTDVGKTYVTGLILKKLHQSGETAAYYKAAMSGNDRGPDGTLYPGDALRVKELSGIPQPVEEMCPYVYEQAVSPHLAARWEGRPVQAEVVYAGFARLCAAYSWVTMEGSGGILCPIRLEEPPIWLPDLVQGLGLGCLLVAEAGHQPGWPDGGLPAPAGDSLTGHRVEPLSAGEPDARGQPGPV